MLSQAQIEACDRDGFIVVEGVLSKDEVAESRRVTEAIVEGARHVAEPTAAAWRATAEWTSNRVP